MDINKRIYKSKKAKKKNGSKIKEGLKKISH